MNIHKALLHIEQMTTLFFKVYVLYFMWLFVIADPQMTVANIGQLLSDKLIFSLILSMVILVHGSIYVISLSSQANRKAVVSNGLSLRAEHSKNDH